MSHLSASGYFLQVNLGVTVAAAAAEAAAAAAAESPPAPSFLPTPFTFSYK